MNNGGEKLPRNNENKFSLGALWEKIKGLGAGGSIENIFKKDEQAKENLELPDKNGEKVVVIRSNGDPIVGIIVGCFGNLYKVCYLVGEELKEKDIEPTELEENQKKYDVNKIESEMYQGKKYKLGQKVNIPRSEGSTSIAYITGYNPEIEMYSVGYMKSTKHVIKSVSVKKQGQKPGNGQIIQEQFEGYGKFLSEEELDGLNK